MRGIRIFLELLIAFCAAVPSYTVLWNALDPGPIGDALRFISLIHNINDQLAVIVEYKANDCTWGDQFYDDPDASVSDYGRRHETLSGGVESLTVSSERCSKMNHTECVG